MQPRIAYSALLQEVMEPISTDVETPESVFMRCKLGMTIWNYYVCK